MKKLLAVLLTAAMTLSMLVVPVTVSAETTTETVGYQDVTVTQTGTTDWANLTDFETNGTYYIKDATGMTKLAELVNGGKATGKNITVYVTVETLDMSSVTSFAGIGTATNPFDGTFDGQGVTITNLSMTTTAAAPFGLFGVANGGAEIKNLVIADTCTFTIAHGTGANGTVLGKATGNVTVNNISSAAKFNDSNGPKDKTGGIVGLVDAGGYTVNVNNCTFSGLFDGTGNKTRSGGIVGYVQTDGTTLNIYNCLNTSDITVAVSSNSGWGEAVGGILGATYQNVTVRVENCVNEGDIDGKEKFGGIAGEVGNTTIVSCVNKGTISAYNYRGGQLGGLVGYVKGTSSISDSQNLGTVKQAKKGAAGGLVGKAEGLLDITNCSNGAAVTADVTVTETDSQTGTTTVYFAPAGGMIGYSSAKVTMSGCTNSGAVSSKSQNVGGMIGESTGADTSITDCTNEGAVKAATTYAGGMVGQIAGADSSIKKCTNNSTVYVETQFGGGIVGNATATLTIEECTNTTNGIITCNAYGTGRSNCGGILGYTSADTTVKNCVNSAKLAGNASAEAGIVGGSEASSLAIEYCVNNGEVNARNGRDVGGILGYTKNASTKVIGCENTGKVYTNNSVGGIVGFADGGTILEVISCNNFGTIEGKGTDTSGLFSSLGGIVGYIKVAATVTNCTNYGELIFKGAYIGGLAGAVQDGYTVDFTNFAQKGIINAPATGFTAKLVCGSEGYTTATINATNCYDATNMVTHFTGYQIGTYTENEVTGNKIRLVGTIGSDYANYDEVGFIVKITRKSDSATKTVEHYCEAIYSSLLAENNETESVTKYRNGGYWFALALYGISAGDYTFEVQTISLAMDGESYTVGETKTFDCTIPALAA